MNKIAFIAKNIYMNKYFLIKNPDLFQGENYLNSGKNYFEGWYFKNTNNEKGISFIPGININNKEQKAFIQVITNDSSYFVNYNIGDFKFNFIPFYIKIKNNFFSKSRIHIDINDDSQKLNIFGDIQYSNLKNITTNAFAPNIMGPFSYIPFMECNHAILSMSNKTNGEININNKKINFIDNSGYIEKDWGVSFPKSYIWCQGNNFSNQNASFMFSIADIPFKLLNFRGIICVLIVDDIEFRFTTYNNVNLLEYDINNEFMNITLKKGDLYLNLNSNFDKGLKLSAPVKGKMEKDIFESISATINITLKRKNDIIFSDKSQNCGLEAVFR